MMATPGPGTVGSHLQFRRRHLLHRAATRDEASEATTLAARSSYNVKPLVRHRRRSRRHTLGVSKNLQFGRHQQDQGARSLKTTPRTCVAVGAHASSMTPYDRTAFGVTSASGRGRRHRHDDCLLTGNAEAGVQNGRSPTADGGVRGDTASFLSSFGSDRPVVLRPDTSTVIVVLTWWHRHCKRDQVTCIARTRESTTTDLTGWKRGSRGMLCRIKTREPLAAVTGLLSERIGTQFLKNCVKP